MDFVTFGLILDDIVFPDGRTAMGALGGGGPQTAFGMRLWSESVGLVAGVGADLPASAWDWLNRSGVDGAGLRVSELPTPRAWQLIEADGRRTHVWRVAGEALGVQLSRALKYVPEGYRRARGFHFGTHPDAPDADFAAGLRALGGLVSLELFRPADRPPAPEALSALLSAAAVFSLNVEEAHSLVGAGEPQELARRLLRAGAQVLTLRLGAEGSLVVADDTAAHIPAVPVAVSNPVGAGNAYCGGFLVGWADLRDVVEAGLRGAVAASFLVEQVSVPVASAELRAEAYRRLEALRPQAGRTTL